MKNDSPPFKLGHHYLVKSNGFCEHYLCHLTTDGYWNLFNYRTLNVFRRELRDSDSESNLRSYLIKGGYKWTEEFFQFDESENYFSIIPYGQLMDHPKKWSFLILLFRGKKYIKTITANFDRFGFWQIVKIKNENEYWPFYQGVKIIHTKKKATIT